MSLVLFLRIELSEDSATGMDRARWLLTDTAGTVLQHSSEAIALASLAGELPDTEKMEVKTVALLPGQHVLVTGVPVSFQHTRHLQSVVAQAVEEQIAEPVDEVHIATGEAAASTDNEEPLYPVAVIHDRWIRRITEALAEAQVSPDIVTAETLLLPCEDRRGIALLSGNTVIFRLSPTTASALETDTFLTFLETWLATNDAPAAIRVLSADAQVGAAFLPRLRAVCEPRGIALEASAFGGDAFEWIACNWVKTPAAAEPVNFLQGPYRLQGWLQSTTMHRKAVACILAGWFVLQTGFDAASGYYLSREAAHYRQQSEALYRTLFPGDDRIVDIRAQTLQHLRKATAATDRGIIAMLGVLAADPALAAAIDIEGLHYSSQTDELLADATAADFDIFERYRQLAPNPAFRVEIASVVREEDGVRGQIRIQGVTP